MAARWRGGGRGEPAGWVERHGRRRRDEPALADGTKVHAM
jgi:hypothetical protein